MNRSEIRATLALSLIYALRMLGMFMVLPVLALYARDLPQGATPMLIGLAIGIYGLVQASLQIPFGALSDRWGRKPVIVIGLLLFAAGSLICALADQIEWVIVGRAVQGAGAISAAASALLADSTRAEVRTQAMAVLGIGVGASFLLALILGPLLAGVIGVDGIFALTGLLALAAIAGLLWLVPTPDQVIASDARSHADIAKVLAVPALLRLDFGIFALHAAMAALFVVVPFSLEQTLGLATQTHWKVYLPVLGLSILPLFALIRWSRKWEQGAMLIAIGLLSTALFAAAHWHAQVIGLLLSLWLFFVAFNYMEAALPSRISRIAPASRKGAALGVYSSAQFMGSFVGAMSGGWAMQNFGLSAGFTAAGILTSVWLLVACFEAPRVPVKTTASDLGG